MDLGGKKLIAITSGRAAHESPPPAGIMKDAVNCDYAEAVSRAGGVPVILPSVCTDEEISFYTELCDGFLISGGMDICPAIYGAMPHPMCGTYDYEVDDSHLRLIKRVLEVNKPLLGICRGMQLINIAAGGTLYQDIPSQYSALSGHQFTYIRHDPVHEVEIEKGSALHGILKADRLYVNSIHHQAVETAGRDVEICARAQDGIIEGITLKHKKTIGVQWHPEMLLKKDDKMLCLFESFIAGFKELGRAESDE